MKVQRYPLYAIVAYAADEALADYVAMRRATLAQAGFAALAVLAAGSFLLRLATHLDFSRARSRKADAALRATLDGSLDAVVIVDDPARRDPRYRSHALGRCRLQRPRGGDDGLPARGGAGPGRCGS